MNTRRPLQPLSPVSPNVLAGTYPAKVSGHLDEPSTMDRHASQDDHTQDSGSGSALSGLTSLENDTDDFGRLMIQNMRDERRLQDTLQGKVQPFRKARTRPRVGLTLENLERNNITSSAGYGSSSGRRRSERAPSESSNGSEPQVRAPIQWGRKARVDRDWLKRIRPDDEFGPHFGGSQEAERENTIDLGAQEETPRVGRTEALDADRPIPSVEDSPLSNRASKHGTPSSYRPQPLQEYDWDLSLDLNEASIIASTPYVPRSTVLDEIRQREIESLKEQAVTTNRLDRLRETSPEETRPSRRASRTSSEPASAERPVSDMASSQSKPRRRTDSSIKSFGSEGERGANPPIVIHKSTETLGLVDQGISANAETNVARPGHRREDSHDLLRRLARASSGTPTPSRAAASRPRTAPPTQSGNSPSKMPASGEAQENARGSQGPIPKPSTQERAVEPQKSLPSPPQSEEPEERKAVTVSDKESDSRPTEAAPPAPAKQPPLELKTPKVTGGWVDTFIDTPAPPTVPAPQEQPGPSSQSPRKGNPSKKPQSSSGSAQGTEEIPPQKIKPTLPGSALEAILEEAKSQDRDEANDGGYGDSTIDSLEDIIDPREEDREVGEFDEDTLQGLSLPTRAPRTEAEKLRQKEVMHLYQMNARLRAARTSIRDASRGIKRVEHQVEDHVEMEDGVRIVYRDCPCAQYGHRNPVLTLLALSWEWFKGLWWDGKSRYRLGLTWLSISVIAFWVWWWIELYLCYHYCHWDCLWISADDFKDPWWLNGTFPPSMPFVTITVLLRSRPLKWVVQFGWYLFRLMYPNYRYSGGGSRGVQIPEAMPATNHRLREWDFSMDADELLR